MASPDKLLVHKMTDQQSGSIFFRSFPQEIRDEIYRHHFSEIILSFSEESGPSQNSLALLKTCRQMRWEIGHRWIHYVHFNFATYFAMRDKLFTLSTYTISEIRYVRVHLGFSRGRCSLAFTTITLLEIIEQLLHLQLDRLTILGDMAPRVAFGIIEDLVANGDGWKELHFIRRYSERFSGPKRLLHTRLLEELRPQALRWYQILENRDGSLTNPSIAVYISKFRNSDGLEVTQLETRHTYEQTIDWEKKEDTSNIVVKRGAGVSYEQGIVCLQDEDK
ncbi:hypothetical protein GGR58DRAFT_498063 [Xylaria digitata]|nr:hypothetical protein GGR58DRAFT_498063 [Xylaria digitata]